MSVYHYRDYAIGTRSGALMLRAGKTALEALTSPEEYESVQPGDDEAYGDVALWGSNNSLPQEMALDIESTGVLSAGIDAKARITIGKGPTPARVVKLNEDGYEELEYVDHQEINDWLELSRGFEASYAGTKDMLGFGIAFYQILLSMDRQKIVAYKRMDPVSCRFSKVDPKTARSEWVYISADWSRWSSLSADEKLHITRVPLLDRDFPLLDLQSRTRGFVFMVAVHYPLTGRSYYPPAPWFCARKWVKITQGIPDMKVAMFNNQITLKYIVEVHPDFWKHFDPTYPAADDATKKKIQDEFYDGVDKYLTGGNNAYKSLFSLLLPSPSGGEPIHAITVTPIDDKIKDGKLLPDAAAANLEILFALMLNPAFVGVDVPGSGAARTAGSGSNIREAFLVQVVLAELERRQISTVFNLAKGYNGWPKDIVLRYPNQVLTTLNTGANTQPTA